MSVVRSRIRELFRSALLRAPVVLVVAPPGYGKTTAIRDAVAAVGDVVWLAIAPGGRLEDFLRALVAALCAKHLPALSALFDGSGTPRDLDRVFRWTEARMRAFTGTIVVDDLHRANADATTIAMLARLIEATAPTISWIVASREQSALPFGTWAAQGLLALPIEAQDLAFDVAEATALARSLDVAIEPRWLDAIVEDTDGWPMAIHFGLQVWERTRAFGPLRIRTRQLLFANIESELWPALDRDARELMTACALLPQIDAGVLEAAGFARAAERLERAYRQISFVQRTEGGYALHDLFREFIVERFQRDADALTGLRDRLARALGARDRAADALRLLTQGADATTILELLGEVGCTLSESGHRGVISDAIDVLARLGQRNHPIVAALRGVAAVADGTWSSAESLFTYAYGQPLPAATRIDVGRRLATLYVNRGEGPRAVAMFEALLAEPSLGAVLRLELRATLCGAYAVAGDGSATLRLLDEICAELGDDDLDAKARILQRLGFAAFFSGDLTRAARLSTAAAEIAIAVGLDFTAAHAYGVLQSIATMQDHDTQLALTYTTLMIGSAERAADASLMGFGYRVEYCYWAERGEVAELANVEARMAPYADMRVFRGSFEARIAKSRLDIATGNARRAIGALGHGDHAAFAPEQEALRAAYLALAYALDGRTPEALELLGRALVGEAERNYIMRVTVNEARAVRGIALWYLDRPAQARRMMSFDEGGMSTRERVLFHAVARICAEPRDGVRTEPLAPIFARLDAAGWGVFSLLLRALLPAAGGANVLTPAERRTLLAFRDGANQATVAERLGKSPHTVEAQLKSVYRKIGCNSRAEALSIARARGWLDTG